MDNDWRKSRNENLNVLNLNVVWHRDLLAGGLARTGQKVKIEILLLCGYVSHLVTANASSSLEQLSSHVLPTQTKLTAPLFTNINKSRARALSPPFRAPNPQPRRSRGQWSRESSRARENRANRLNVNDGKSVVSPCSAPADDGGARARF